MSDDDDENLYDTVADLRAKQARDAETPLTDAAYQQSIIPAKEGDMRSAYGIMHRNSLAIERDRTDARILIREMAEGLGDIVKMKHKADGTDAMRLTLMAKNLLTRAEAFLNSKRGAP